MPDSQDDFLSFRTLISRGFIRAAYVIGAVAITGAAVFTIFVSALNVVAGDEAAGKSSFNLPALAAGVAGLVLGNVLWRLACEGWMLLFSVHEMLGTIEHALNRDDENIGLKVKYIADQLRATEANNDLRHAEMIQTLRAAGPQHVMPLPPPPQRRS